MSRRDRVLRAVEALAKERQPVGCGPPGVTAADVARYCGISRENASRELNRLCAEGRLGKSGGRPVRFRLPGSAREAPEPDPGAFRRMIGYDGTLQVIVEKAKAAMVYPGGLHTLITGPTGSGKTMLARAMHEFGIQSGSLRPNAPLIVFNCAEYARNEELLASHLFGHVKGAFTGADADREGLVERADGGVLLLDEVHRLPPSAQEMLFLLMDSGMYRRVGEAGRERRASVLIIACTTEDPGSALLQTFLRRVPVLISMPAFADWSVGERVLVVRHILAGEADHLGRALCVGQATFDRWVDFHGAGNIGQLRSIIQVAVAKALLKSGPGRGPVMIGDAAEPADGTGSIMVRPGAATDLSQRNLLDEMSRLIDGGARVDEALSSAMARLDAGRFTLQRRARSGAVGLAEYLVPGHVRQAAARAIETATGILGVSFGPAHQLRLALHLAAAIGRADSRRAHADIPEGSTQAQRTAAEAMLRRIEEGLGVDLPPAEAAYLVRFLMVAAGEQPREQPAPTRPVILATCFSGEGAAARIGDTLRNVFGDSVSVVCCGERDVDAALGTAGVDRRMIVAAVGSVDPRLPGVHFIPVEELIMGDGLRDLVDLLGLDPSRLDAYEFSMAGSLTLATLLDSMVFLNPHKALSEAESFVRAVELGLGRSLGKAVRVRLMVHTACMLERLIRGKTVGTDDGIGRRDRAEPGGLQGVLAEQVRRALAHVESAFNLKVPDGEILILTQIVENELP